MKISNKLSTKDIVALQKFIVEERQYSKGYTFLLKYVMNLVNGFMVFTVLYFILPKYGINNILIPILAGVSVFLILLLFHKKIFSSRMNRIIKKYYGRDTININRVVTFEDESFIVEDEGKEPKKYEIKEVLKSKLDGNRLLLILGDDRGLVMDVSSLKELELNELKNKFIKTGV